MPARRPLQAKNLLALTLIAASLAACGGGGGGSGPDTVAPDSGGAGGSISTPKPSATPATIEFSSADPTSIYPASLGGINRSTVSFVVKDANGKPVANQPVNFNIDTPGAGLNLVNTRALTDTDGLVKTQVLAGDVSTVVNIIAELEPAALGIKVRSNELVVVTKMPRSLTLAAKTYNPEFGNWQGETTEIAAIAVDENGHAVRDGISVFFRAEGSGVGLITPSSCKLVSGQCKVTLTSTAGGASRISNGRQTILAYLGGEESFVDSSPFNGLHDQGESYTDRPEVFLDANRNGIWDIGEWFQDLNGDGKHNADGVYNGNRNYPSLGRQTVNLWDDVEIVWSGSFWAQGSTPTGRLCIEATPPAAQLTPSSVSISIPLKDSNGNTLPEGTTMSVTGFTNVTLAGQTFFTVGKTSTAITRTVTVTPNSCTPAPTGTITIKVKTPKGDDVEQQINL